jgi:hypothetical protein
MTEMVDLCVGPERKHFRVYKALLWKKIPYFEKMFKGGKECSERVGTFPEDNPQSFDILIKWVYSRILQTLAHVTEAKQLWVNSFNISDLNALLDKICFPRLMDALVSSYIESSVSCHFLPNSYFIGGTYVKAREGDGLRKFVLYSFAYILSGMSRSEGHLQIWPTSSLEQLMVKHPSLVREYLELVRQSPIGELPKDPRTMPRCVFHQHGKDEGCSLK